MRAMFITGVGAWTPGMASAQAWTERRGDPTVIRPAAALLPSRERRRASLLTRAAASAFEEAVAQSGEDAATIATVFGSAYGEGSTLELLLDQLGGPDGALSPMRFAGSVHNTASGMLSIACDARGFTTSIAAGELTLIACLQEAAGLLADGHGAVVVVVADCTAPTSLTADAEHFDTLAAAFVLRAQPAMGPDSSVLSRILAIGEPDSQRRLATPLPSRLRSNPCVAALLLLDAIAAGATGTIGLDPLPERPDRQPCWLTVAAGSAPFAHVDSIPRGGA